MKKTLAAAALLLLAGDAFGADPPAKSKVHGFSVTGTVLSVEEGPKKMVVRTVAGKQVPLVWTGATKTVGGSLKAGARVTVRYLQKDGKNIATSIQVAEEKPADGSAAAPAAAPTVTATASPR